MTMQQLSISHNVLICPSCKLVLSGMLELCPRCVHELEVIPLCKGESYRYTYTEKRGPEFEFI